MNRSMVDHVLDGLQYPCDRERLVRHAAACGAGDGVLGALAALSVHARFDGAAAVHDALQAADRANPDGGPG